MKNKALKASLNGVKSAPTEMEALYISIAAGGTWKGRPVSYRSKNGAFKEGHMFDNTMKNGIRTIYLAGAGGYMELKCNIGNEASLKDVLMPA